MLTETTRIALYYKEDPDKFVKVDHQYSGGYPDPVPIHQADFWSDMDKAKQYARHWPDKFGFAYVVISIDRM